MWGCGLRAWTLLSRHSCFHFRVSHWSLLPRRSRLCVWQSYVISFSSCPIVSRCAGREGGWLRSFNRMSENTTVQSIFVPMSQPPVSSVNQSFVFQYSQLSTSCCSLLDHLLPRYSYWHWDDILIIFHPKTEPEAGSIVPFIHTIRYDERWIDDQAWRTPLTPLHHGIWLGRKFLTNHPQQWKPTMMVTHLGTSTYKPITTVSWELLNVSVSQLRWKPQLMIDWVDGLLPRGVHTLPLSQTQSRSHEKTSGL